jgi:hypothetical protein
MFGRLLVSLDHLAPAKGAFAYALDWAWHLQRPLQALAGVNESADGRAERSAQCARACARRGISWRGVRPTSDTAQEGDLIVVGQSQRRLLRETTHCGSAALVCPDNWQRLERPLVLNEAGSAAEAFLEAALALCRCFGTVPVILTLARSQRVAGRRQRAAQAAVTSAGMTAAFDSLIGSDSGLAAATIARWRHCPLVIRRGPGAPSLWRRLRGSAADQLDFADSIAFLTLPDGGLVSQGCQLSRPAEEAGAHAIAHGRG